MKRTLTRLIARFSIPLATLGISAALLAQGDSEPIHQTVARVSYISGAVSYARGDDPDNWQNAAVNVPLTLGDRMFAGDDGRAELALGNRSYIRISAGSNLSALNMTDDVKQFSLNGGTASLIVRAIGNDETLEVDTPNVAVTVDRPGDYRIDVDQDGNSRVSVRRGHVIAAAAGGQVPVESDQMMVVNGTDAPQYDIVAIPAPDSWDRWVMTRQSRVDRFHSVRYVNADLVGVEDLDEYGSWQNIPDYGYVWTPSAMDMGWTPYRVGHWCWQDPWGWTWIADEPWGWAPYHYGRWVTYSSRWFWVPVAPSVRFYSYSPALVGFVGGGPGWSASFAVGGGGYVGWFPLAPRDPFIPWWGPRVSVNVTNINYVNRSYVTVVNRNTFVGGVGVSSVVVRDPAVLRQISSAPVLRGPVPLMPTAASLRVGASASLSAPVRPSAMIASRAVVTRIAPAPAPPTFQSKVASIRQNGGAPVAPAAAMRLSAQAPGGARSVTLVKPVASGGAVSLRPASSSTSLPKPQPVTATPASHQPMTSTYRPAPSTSSPVVHTPPPSSTPVKPAPIVTDSRRTRKVSSTPPVYHADSSHVTPKSQTTNGSGKPVVTQSHTPPPVTKVTPTPKPKPKGPEPKKENKDDKHPKD